MRREITNAIHTRTAPGCAWRHLPHDFPAWDTCHGYFATWQKVGSSSSPAWRAGC
ncbi:transposase [Streptomyces oryzae]|uniref:Transposase n=1 Tax=Streptomyces oryzae TaxID=1434886 RepID=A0ABS3X8Y6_9ACTN|nr:transposase [Streptomyces oryzae]